MKGTKSPRLSDFRMLKLGTPSYRQLLDDATLGSLLFMLRALNQQYKRSPSLT
jgi:hypothetical protein